VVPPTRSSTASTSLARRLCDLRQSRFPGTKLTLSDLAQALSEDEQVAVATLSAWENVRAPVLPPRERLAAIARFFATDRSLEGGRAHLVPLAQLSDAEHEVRKELERELLRLRDNDASEVTRSGQFWCFEDRAPITVICSELSGSDEVKLGPFSDADNPNYTRLYSFADLDALIELYGHLNSSNPDALINFLMASQVTSKDLIGHIVLLGGIAWNDVTRRLNTSAELPVRQVRNAGIHSGEVFELEIGPDRGQQFLPRWRDDNPGTPDNPGIILEDVGMLARLPNPFNVLRTLTYCNGIHSRGVLGAVRCLTDPAVRNDNEIYLEETFLAVDRFVILMRVPVLGSQTISPSLKNPGAVLFHWPAV
jgi:hypothetical protein